MSASTKKSWWIKQPGELTGARSGGLLSGLFGLALGVLLLTAALGLGLQAMVAPDGFTAGARAVGAGMLGFVGLHLAMWGEGAFGGGFGDGKGPSTTRMALGARVAVAASVLIGVGAELARIAGWTSGPRASGDVSDGVGVAAMALVPALIAGVLLSRRLLRSDGARWHRVVIGWTGFTALLLVTGLAFVGFVWFRTGDLASSVSFSGRWMGWTVAGSALAVLMAASARKRLSIWDGADRWRDATLTPDLRLAFADGSGSRSASAYFNGYSGPVVVMPTAAEAGSVFRGDGAPADGWVVPGTRAALEEAVRCARAMAAVTVAAVALVATAPLAVWLVSLVG